MAKPRKPELEPKPDEERREAIGPESDGPSPLLVLLALVGLLVLVYVGLHFVVVPEPIGANHPVVGTPLENLSLTPMGRPGPTKTLADLKGFVTVVNYWGPWCGYCRVEMPHLLKLEEKLRENAKFQLLLVSCSGDPRESEEELAEESDEFLKELDTDLLAWSDPGQVSRRALVKSAQLDGFGYPTTVLLDGEGRIRGLWIGFESGDEKQLEKEVMKALAE